MIELLDQTNAIGFLRGRKGRKLGAGSRCAFAKMTCGFTTTWMSAAATGSNAVSNTRF